MPGPSHRFPLGIYGVQTVPDLEAVSAAGFSLVTGPLNRDFMETALARGVGVFASPGTSAGPSFDPVAARTAIGRWDRHLALSAWYVIDEPDMAGLAPDSVELAHNTLINVGATKPTALVVCRGPNLALFHSTDILMVDFYPVGWIPVPAFFQHMRHGATAANAANKKFIAVIQAMDWDAYRKDFPFPEPFHPRPPSEAELRSMAWGARVLGADGLFFYPYRDGNWEMTKRPETWKALTNVVQEIRHWETIFAAARSGYPPSTEMVSEYFNEALEAPILWSVRKVECGNGQVAPGNYWIMVNTTERIQDFRVLDTEWQNTSQPSLLTGEKMDIDEEGWTEGLKPFEVRVLGPVISALDSSKVTK